MGGQDEGPGGVAEPGSGAEHKDDGPGPEGGAQGQMELGALRAFVEAGLHNVDARLDQQAGIQAPVPFEGLRRRARLSSGVRREGRAKRCWGKFVEFFVFIKNENCVVGLRKSFHIRFGYGHGE